MEKFQEKSLVDIVKSAIFALTVLAALKSARTAYQGESFAFKSFSQNINTPPLLPLSYQIAHLGGFFLYIHLHL